MRRESRDRKERGPGRRSDNRISLSAWVPVLLCYSVILATVPVARNIQEFVYDAAGAEFFTRIVIIAVLSGSGILLYSFAFRLKVERRSQYVWILACAAIFLFYTIRLDKHPEEAVHFLEYGILAFVIFRALSRSIPDMTVYLSSLFLVSLAGISDELVQWMTPQRFWDFRDIGLNTFAGSVVLVGIWRGLRPDIVCRNVKRSSVTVLAGFMTAHLLLLGLCLSNTPEAVHRYTAAVDSLSWLRSEEPMAEYGFVHRDSEIGTFYSRMPAGELQATDTKEGAHYGDILHRSLTQGTGINDLLNTYHPSADAFLNEFLMHVAARDESIQSMESASVPDTATGFAFVAFRQNLILERYFGKTLNHSGLFLPDEVNERLRVIPFPPGKEFTSEAGSSLITSFDVGDLWKGIILIVSLVWIAVGTRKKKIKD